ncbi:MAG: LysE family transporter [Candidatus Promineifilaceae bacterium]
MSPILQGMLAGFGIAMPVGPVALLIVNTSVRCGLRAGLMAGAGAASADLFYAVLATAAGLAISAIVQPLATPLAIIGGLALMALALSGLWRGLRQAPASQQAMESCPPWQMYFRFLAITIINPLTIVYFTAIVVGSVGTSRQVSVPDALQFVLGAGFASLLWQSLLAVIGGVAVRRLSPNLRVAAIAAGNILVLVLGALLLLRGVR